MSLRPKKGCVTMYILGVYTHSYADPAPPPHPHSEILYPPVNRNTSNPPILPSPHFRWVVIRYSTCMSPISMLTINNALAAPGDRGCHVAQYSHLSLNTKAPLS